ncbi:23588_t:CDS:2 [Gigaspora margarita]|uniref:23588_t:CDS:1 n=1 Tax=Gigaspora margarita TaxID=4874 RepID=A0ABM8VZ35_GIGMA|nr:23588_t:CDS:2 [Gigaspora margarita]
MKDGEKRKARKLVYQAAQLVEEKTSLPFLTVFEGAVANAKPYWELRIEGAREAKKKTPHLPFSQLLGESIFDAYNKKGGAIQKKEAIQKKGEENKAFATFLNRR